ncbi:cell division protein FtsA [Microbacter margulisiae]|uniref:Cell division protein FtsA n=1 Tax=Microbacter margulisiae TaxID=1350067 RepID=A0A7W5DPJ7_9PORP|nr:cell division protein FtsA [Microbacter margulisiae]MBB3186715.1 cell division protein FtsA [Microbacter margulisiae]
MDATNTYIALSIGSAYITAVAAQVNDESQIRILASERRPSEGIRHGEILNPSATGFVVKNTLELLENRIKEKIARVYVGINGRSLKTFNTTLEREFPQQKNIQAFVLEDMYQEINQAQLEEGKIYDIFQQETLIDGEPEMNPVGCNCLSIASNFRVVVGKPELGENVNRCFDRTGYTTVETPLQIIKTAQAMLSPIEREQGCVLVDFGASCTSIVVYHHNLMRYLWVLPLGGNNLTRDLMSLGVSEEIAEELKIRFGNAISKSVNATQRVNVRSEADETTILKLPLQTIAMVTEARATEIVDAVWKAIQRSGVSNDLGAGIILAGNAAKLQNLDQLLQQQTNLPVRFGSHSRFLADGTHPQYHDISYAPIIGLLLTANQDCLYKVTTQESSEVNEPKIKRKNPFSKIGNKLADSLVDLFKNES